MSLRLLFALLICMAGSVGAQPYPSKPPTHRMRPTPEQLGVFQKSEIIKWAMMVKDAGIQPE